MYQLAFVFGFICCFVLFRRFRCFVVFVVSSLVWSIELSVNVRSMFVFSPIVMYTYLETFVHYN